MMKFTKTYKKCPRCGNKCALNQDKCEECGLIFSRMQYASNKAAKKKILKFDTDFVIYTNQYPSDVSWWKLMLITFLLGIVGGQYYYTGKYIKGGLMSASFVYLVFCTAFNTQISMLMETHYLYFPIGIAAIAWIVSIVYVCSKKFKVPVIVQMPDAEVEYQRKQLEKTKEEIKAEKSRLKNEKAIASNKSKIKKNNKTNKNEEIDVEEENKQNQRVEK